MDESYTSTAEWRKVLRRDLEPPAMDGDNLQAIAAQDQLWASLRALRLEIDRLAAGRFDGSERERPLILLLARIVAEELNFRAGAAP